MKDIIVVFMQKKNKIFFFNLSIVIIIFLIDRITKIHVINLFDTLNDQQIFIAPFLNLYLIWNSGIAFGLLSFDSNEIYNFITFFIAIINIIIIYIFIKIDDVRRYFFSMILGGSLGNLFDRLVYNAVPDFIDFHFGDLHWFIFNPADIFITIGVICLILVEFFSKDKKDV